MNKKKGLWAAVSGGLLVCGALLRFALRGCAYWGYALAFVAALIVLHHFVGPALWRFIVVLVCVGLACVVGHTLTVFMRFRGGKGVATAFGMMIALAPYPTLAAFGVFVATVWLSHYISLGSILAAVTLGTVVWFVPATPLLRGVVTAIAVFVVAKHRSNIARLAKGCENKIY